MIREADSARGADPAIEKRAEPGAGAVVVDGAVLEMRGARARARHGEALVAARRPFMHHGVGDVGVELQRIRGGAVAERLHLEHVAFGEQVRARRQIETLAVPFVDVLRPRIDHGAAGRCRADRVIADLGMAVRMLVDPAAERPRAHLRAEADAEERLLLLERHRDPVDFAADEIVLVVGAHRAAEDHDAGVIGQRRRQRVVETRTAHVERMAELLERAADAAGRGMFLVQDDQDRLAHDRRHVAGQSNPMLRAANSYRVCGNFQCGGRNAATSRARPRVHFMPIDNREQQRMRHKAHERGREPVAEAGHDHPATVHEGA